MFAPWERGDFSSADWADPEIVSRLQNGKVTSFVIYVNREHALADLGLAPDSGSSGS